VTRLEVIVLAAGKGTRMKSALPKVLHPVGGEPMLRRVIEQATGLETMPSRVHVVVGHGADQVRAWAGQGLPADLPVHWVQQVEQLGTGHAVAQALPAVSDDSRVLVLYGDVPTVPCDELDALLATPGLALLSARVADPSGYGRIVRDMQGQVRAIVEDREADDAQRAIDEINTGILAAPADALKRWVAALRNDNAKGEYYLTDCIAMAVADGTAVAARVARDAAALEGVNDRLQLAQAERRFQLAQARRLMAEGLYLSDPARFDLRGRLRIGRDVRIDVGCVFEGDVELADEVEVGAYSVLRNCRVGAGTRIEPHCVFDGATIGRNTTLGPFARLRPGAQLADEVHVGNFVEIKQATLGVGTKAGHLAYVGDASVGAGVNISAGVITCNYDGANKHRTTIGDGAFIGTDTQLIAPVSIGAGAYIAAGSTIRKDAPDGQLTICRAREQVSVAAWKPPVKRPKGG